MPNVSTMPSHATSRETNQPPAQSVHGALCIYASSQLPLAVCRCARSRFNHFHKIANCPERISDASGHCWRASNRDIGFDEIVIGIVKRDSGLEVFQLLRESVGQ